MTGRLGDILIRRGEITESQLEVALRSQGTERGMLGSILVSQGLISFDQLGSALSEQFQVPFYEVVPEVINPQIVRLLPESFARERQAVAVGVESGTLQLAMGAPDDIETIAEVELITGYAVDPLVTFDSAIHSALDRGFDDRIVARQTIVDMKISELEDAAKRAKHRAVNYCLFLGSAV